jgi:hypothetical protein
MVESRFGIRWGKEQENRYLMEVQPHTHSLDAGDLEAASPIPSIAQERQEIHFIENCSVFGGGGSLQPSGCAKLQICCQRQLKECT